MSSTVAFMQSETTRLELGQAHQDALLLPSGLTLKRAQTHFHMDLWSTGALAQGVPIGVLDTRPTISPSLMVAKLLLILIALTLSHSMTLSPAQVECLGTLLQGSPRAGQRGTGTFLDRVADFRHRQMRTQGAGTSLEYTHQRLAGISL